MNPSKLLLLGALCTLPFSANLSAKSAYSVTTDSEDGIFELGDTASFQITKTDPTNQARARYRFYKDRWDTQETVDLSTEISEQTVSLTPSEAGWYRCTILVDGEKRPAGESGAVFNPDSFAPAFLVPDDFDAFWDQQKARLKADPATATLEPLTPEQFEIEAKNTDHRNKIERIANSGYSYSNLEIPCLDVEPVRAYYAKPEMATSGGHPAIILFHAAGVNGGWCRSSLVQTLSMAEKYNAIVIDINAHGMLNGQPQDYYDALDKGPLKNYRYQGNQSRETSYFLGMYLRLMRAIDFLCSQPEWDGQNLICYGISQGGGQALAAAGLDSRVSAVVATVPALCNVGGAVEGWPGLGKVDAGSAEEAAVSNTMRYFDSVNFCTRSNADTLMTVGLIDSTCPAPGVFAAYNQLNTPKRILSVPDQGHHQLSVPSSALRREYHEFILKHTKAQ